MSKFSASDNEDDDLDRPSPLLQTKRFSKGSFSSSSNKTKRPTDSSDMRLNLDRVHRTNDDDDDDESLHDSDDETNSRTARSTSSATTSPLTPKPRERTFMKNQGEKPATKPRRIDIDDDDRNVFGNTTMKPSPRQYPTSAREDEENARSFAQQFANKTKRQSPTDMFNTRKPSADVLEVRSDDDDDSDSDRWNKSSNRKNSRMEEDLPKSRRESHRSDDERAAENVLKRQNFMKAKPSSEETGHPISSSRPSSANRKDPEPMRRPSHPEETEDPPTTTAAPSRPSSAKSVTNRQQTQSIIDQVSSANHPSTDHGLTSQNESLAATLQPIASETPRIAKLPPKPKSSSTVGANRKKKYPVPSQYKEVTSRIDSGRTPVEQLDLRQSIERAMKKAMQSQPLPRPQSARSVERSPSRERRRRLSSAYEHVQPKVNTNRSINLDNLDTSQLRQDSSQSIKDAVYLEWLKTKEEEKKRTKQKMKEWQETREKSLDKTSIEREAYREAQKLQQWRKEKEDEARKKRLEELKAKREAEQAKRDEESRKKRDAAAGFDDWASKKSETIVKQREEEEQKKKEAIEREQEEKRKRELDAQKKFHEWVEKKQKGNKEKQKEQKTVREDQIKKIHQEKEQRYVSAQEAYENWLKQKEKYEEEQMMNRSRRNSLSNNKPPVPFLPGGAQRNTGRVRHVVW